MNNIIRLVGRMAFVFVALATAPSVSAASGWYLFFPPRDNNGFPEVSKPLSQWVQQGAYDSASECEAVKNYRWKVEMDFHNGALKRYNDAFSAKKDPVELKLINLSIETSNANADAWMASRCIKSDDPRLGK